jgi:hypothetical protein
MKGSCEMRGGGKKCVHNFAGRASEKQPCGR